MFPGCVLGTAVGFMHPDPNAAPNPIYKDVKKGDTGFVEVLHILFDSSKASYEDVVRHFFQFHDPTTANRQINDKGT